MQKPEIIDLPLLAIDWLPLLIDLTTFINSWDLYVDMIIDSLYAYFSASA